MAIRPITFGGENATPKNDGGLYAAHHGDGILWGCVMSLVGTPYTDLQISTGELIAGGRVIWIDGATNIDLTGISNTANYAQIILNIEIGHEPVVYTSIAESDDTSFLPLTQEDINDNGVLYQVQLAIIQMSGGSPTSIYSSIGQSPLVLNAESTMQNLFFKDGNDYIGRLSRESGGNILLAHTTANGSYGNGSGSGVYMPTTGAVRIFGKGGGIYLRPNGITSTAGQMYIDTDGQQIGGHPLNAPSTAISDKSLSANTITELHAFTGLDSSGVYACSGKFTYTPSGTTAHYPEIRIAGSTQTSTTRAQNSFYSASSTAKYMSISTVFTGLSRITLYAHTHSSSVTATASDIRFELVRLG